MSGKTWCALKGDISNRATLAMDGWREAKAKQSHASAERNPTCDKESNVGKNVVRLEGETSNQLFETLAEWNTYLERHVPKMPEPQP